MSSLEQMQQALAVYLWPTNIINKISVLQLPGRLALGATLTLLLVFIGRFLIPGIYKWWCIHRAIKNIKLLKEKYRKTIVPPKDIRREAMRGRLFRHLWTEYTHTLHEQLPEDPSYPKSWRSTAPAEVFFSSQAIVDTSLKTEFFKHLPGILTGIGIIGTFFGLIAGLSSFAISDDPSIVRKSLEELIHGVEDAFLVSAFAILIAILCTFSEKFIVTLCYKKVEQLCQAIDSLYKAGAGEEYLARLVYASETSATQTQQLKDALVSDLKQVLSDLTQKQIEAQTHASQQTAQAITNAIAGPLKQISEAVKITTGDQKEAVAKLLTDVVAAFSANVKDVFGDQLSGMKEVLREVVSSLQTTVARFTDLAINIDSAGQNAANAMAGRVEAVLKSLEERHERTNASLTEFVNQLREMTKDSQNATSQKLAEMLANIEESVTSILKGIEQRERDISDNHSQQQKALSDRSEKMFDGLSGNVTGLLEKITEMTAAMQASVTRMQQVTTEAIGRMNSGAENLVLAADEFSEAAKAADAVVKGASPISERLAVVAGSLIDAAKTAQDAISSYRETRDALSTMVGDLKSTIEAAKREASVTNDLVSSIERASKQLTITQRDMEEYLAGISRVLAESHSSFAEGMTKTLGEANTGFQQQLSTATSLLSSTIKDLQDAFESIPGKG